MTNRLEVKPETPSTSLRETFVSLGVSDSRGFSTKCKPLQSRDWRVIQLIRYSVQGYGLLLSYNQNLCQRWEQFFETQVMEVSETSSLKIWLLAASVVVV